MIYPTYLIRPAIKITVVIYGKKHNPENFILSLQEIPTIR